MFDNIDDFKKNFDWINQLNTKNFEDTALKIFHYQAQKNPIYRDYIRAIGKNAEKILYWQDIPFLPIGFFKTHRVLCEAAEATDYFESSGTTGMINSHHYLPDKALYKACFLNNFKQFYGDPAQYTFFCLLPSYLERGHSSLVFMAKELISQSNSPESAFYLHDFKQLKDELLASKKKSRKVILLGVTFALLDFADFSPMDLSGIIVMETGGMKGRREERTRQQVHDYLKERWNLAKIHSEYGMAELFSQAYSKGDGIYFSGNTLRISIRDKNDPLSNFETGSGCLNITDLGNLYSCSFIATEDLGKINENGSFEVQGRMDHSALRGCSLMAI